MIYVHKIINNMAVSYHNYPQNFKQLPGKPIKTATLHFPEYLDKKLSYCWETVRRESMPRMAEMNVEMTT